jgi:hypothetical protein
MQKPTPISKPNQNSHQLETPKHQSFNQNQTSLKASSRIQNQDTAKPKPTKTKTKTKTNTEIRVGVGFNIGFVRLVVGFGLVFFVFFCGFGFVCTLSVVLVLVMVLQFWSCFLCKLSCFSFRSFSSGSGCIFVLLSWV